MLGQFGVLLLFRVLCNTCANFSAVSLTAKLPEHACLPLVLKTQRFHFELSLVSCLHITLHYNRKIVQKPGFVSTKQGCWLEIDLFSRLAMRMCCTNWTWRSCFYAPHMYEVTAWNVTVCILLNKIWDFLFLFQRISALLSFILLFHLFYCI